MKRIKELFKEFNILPNIWKATVEFFKQDGLDRASVLAYYSIFSTLFILTFFTFIFTKFIGNPEIAYKTIYPFSPDFFSKISPQILKKAEQISLRLEDFGIVGLVLSIVLGILIFNKIIHYVNDMFFIKLKKGFIWKRVKEFALLFIVGFLVMASFAFTGIISTITTLFYKNDFIRSHLNPNFINSLNNFLIKYIVPFLITFLLFFIIYKWIPETIVCIRASLIAALFSTLLWEIIKRAYAYYLVNISLIGKIKGPIIAIILFGFWMEFSMGILLYGAKLTYILNKEKNGKIR